MCFEKIKKMSLPFVGFLQAAGLTVYCLLVGVLFWQGNSLFGPPFSFVGPAMFLVLFVASALISALLTLGYPGVLFFKEKETVKALKLIFYTASWLVVFIFLLMGILIVK